MPGRIVSAGGSMEMLIGIEWPPAYAGRPTQAQEPRKMSAPSLTGTDSFRLRIQRSEADRAVLMCIIYGALILLTVIRRVAGGVVMADDRIFLASIGILLVAAAYEVFVALALRTALRQSRLIVGWRLTANAVFELMVPAALLTVMHFLSPRGEYAALSGPALLLFPLTILMSVLRLRPRTTLWIGLGAAAFHAALVTRTIVVEDIAAGQYPVLYSYAGVLALSAVGGSLVTRSARRYVSEAVEEAEAHERSSIRLEAMERDLEVARQIQLGLLPSKPPRFAGFDFAGMNIPADQTGGDYYDWQELPDGRVLVVMADVTGHGIGPALVMAVCRAYARASAPLDTDPVSLMSRLNTLLHADMKTGRFITLAMAAIDPGGGVQLVSAGHGPSFLCRAGEGPIEQFGGDGLPLAVEAVETYGPPRLFTMERGDLLVMLTDGVFEWQNAAGTQFGTERLAAAISRSASRSPKAIVDSIHAAAVEFAGGAPQTDDVTIVVIKRTG